MVATLWVLAIIAVVLWCAFGYLFYLGNRPGDNFSVGALAIFVGVASAVVSIVGLVVFGVHLWA